VLWQVPGWILIALAGFVLHVFLDLPLWIVWSVVGFWVGKYLVLFPFLWRFVVPDLPSRAHSMAGLHGVAAEPWRRLATCACAANCGKPKHRLPTGRSGAAHACG
jgi:hypothetical protein